MKDIQEIFNRIQVNKKKLKELKSVYKDALETTPGYKDLVEDVKIAREKKKRMEAEVKQEMTSEFDDIERIKIDIASDQQMMTDIAMSQFMKGEPVEILDEYENTYEPEFSIKFKKM